MDLRKTQTELSPDNSLPRMQLIVAARNSCRALFTPSERTATRLLARFTRSWWDAMLLVQPNTVLRWRPKAFKLACSLRSRPKNLETRNKTSKETIELIRRMAKENRRWSAERIRGELLKHGLHVAKLTAQKPIQQPRRGTSPGSQQWSTLLPEHAHESAARQLPRQPSFLVRGSTKYPPLP